MKSFWMILIATSVAATALIVERLTDAYRHTTIQAVVAACLVVIFVVLINYMVKSNE